MARKKPKQTESENLRRAQQFARERIQKAVDEGADNLYLGGNKMLREIPPEIEQLAPTLKHLSFADSPPGAEVTFSDPQPSAAMIESLESLRHLRQLESLDLSFCYELKSLEGVRNLRSLRRLKLTACDKFSDLAPLEKLDQLEKLELGLCRGIKSMAAISGFPHLAELEVWGPQLKELNELSDLPGLRKLKLWDCSSLRSLEGIQQFSTLKSLRVSDGRISDVAPLRDLPKLAELCLSHCRALNSLADLPHLHSLRKLQLFCSYRHSDLRPLAGLTQVTDLEVSSTNHLRRTKGVEALVQLDRLSLYNCEKLSSIEGLGALTRLNELDLTYCKSLRNIRELAKLRSLRTLQLRFCERLLEADALRSLTNLEVLTLSNCRRLADFGFLECLPNLRELDVMATSITPEELLSANESGAEIFQSLINAEHFPGEADNRETRLERTREAAKVPRRKRPFSMWFTHKEPTIDEHSFRIQLDLRPYKSGDLEIGCAGFLIAGIAFLWKGILAAFPCLLLILLLWKANELLQRKEDILEIKDRRVHWQRIRSIFRKGGTFPLEQFRSVEMRDLNEGNAELNPYFQLVLTCDNDHALVDVGDQNRKDVEQLVWLIQDTVERQLQKD